MFGLNLKGLAEGPQARTIFLVLKGVWFKSGP